MRNFIDKIEWPSFRVSLQIAPKMQCLAGIKAFLEGFKMVKNHFDLLPSAQFREPYRDPYGFKSEDSNAGTLPKAS